METAILTFRIMYYSIIGINLLLIIKKMRLHLKSVKNEIYYSAWIFGTALFISVFFNLTFFMSDIIADSWHNLETDSFALLTVMNIMNLFITFVIFFGTKKRLTINSTSFIVYNLFSKKYIEFSSIDIGKSIYIFNFAKPNKLLPKKNIFGHREYLHIYLKSGEEVQINLNPFLLSGNRNLLFTVVVKNLKINRKTLK